MENASGTRTGYRSSIIVHHVNTTVKAERIAAFLNECLQFSESRRPWRLSGGGLNSSAENGNLGQFTRCSGIKELSNMCVLLEKCWPTIVL